MLNELEQKIRKAIPELQELGVGCIVNIQEHVLSDKLISVYIVNLHSNKNYFMLSNNCLTNKNMFEEIIGKPIQLNHVLDYVQKKHDYDFSQPIDRIILYILSLWNLKSNLLSEQSEELIKFVNEL